MNTIARQATILVALVLVALVGCKKKDTTGPVIDDDTASADDLVGLFPAVKVPNFTCDPGAMPEGSIIAEAVDATGAEAAGRLHIINGEDCNFDLAYREPGQPQMNFTTGDRAGYLLAMLHQFENGDVGFCTSRVEHTPVDGAGDNYRQIDQVKLQCAFRFNMVWSRLQDIVVPEPGEWAAWPSGLRVEDNLFVAEFMHDSTMQFMNGEALGRPADDGIYEAAIAMTGPTDRADVTIDRVGSYRDRIVYKENGVRMAPDEDGAGQGNWEPTEEEMEELGDIIDFSGGDCQDGCEADCNNGGDDDGDGRVDCDDPDCHDDILCQ